MIQPETYRILIAEDDPSVRELVQEVLRAEGYIVSAAHDGQDALDQLEICTFDMVISDIQMPRRDGFSLLQEVRRLYPSMQRIILTAYNADEYMDLIHMEGIGNVLIKGVPFDSSELCMLVRQLASHDIFGLDKHLLPGTVIQSARIRRSREIEDLSKELSCLYGESNNGSKLHTVLIELLTNAVFYGARNETGEDKSVWRKDFELAENDAIEVHYGEDGEKTGLAIVDHGGRLNKNTILYWLNRQITPSSNGLPAGIFDSHGRGIYIVRKSVDCLQIHVDPGNRCECIVLNYKKPLTGKFKPVRIIEL